MTLPEFYAKLKEFDPKLAEEVIPRFRANIQAIFLGHIRPAFPYRKKNPIEYYKMLNKFTDSPSSIINRVFIWDDTPEGSRYWYSIKFKLSGLL